MGIVTKDIMALALNAAATTWVMPATHNLALSTALPGAHARSALVANSRAGREVSMSYDGVACPKCGGLFQEDFECRESACGEAGESQLFEAHDAAVPGLILDSPSDEQDEKKQGCCGCCP